MTPVPKDRPVAVKVNIRGAFGETHLFHYNVQWCPRSNLFRSPCGTAFGEPYIRDWCEPTDHNVYARFSA